MHETAPTHPISAQRALHNDQDNLQFSNSAKSKPAQSKSGTMEDHQ
ncbi:predicted protein [Plenodomus lingam JN3]|uniref:Predicted protein n=1 Tax=Leptosphaeria maculans (strain JN3 / isolate v23.1.3 / race Av1-4-5-6-7-8) TaxID=985895 RepID=E4ZV43_LEPMJ|nr:predicted protein [Plenodomus lingam JN3]CBX95469.1 predicted protein [Plenodomus lingam JN3]